MITRREFSKLLLGAVALGLVESSAIGKVFGQTKRSMLWLAEQTASAEGTWKSLKIEGKLPKDLNGTLFRTTPGMTENFGTKLNHLFDGDAYLSSWRFSDGKVELTGRFVPTPSRLKEQEAKKMLFSEYGTFAENRSNGGKNQPSVNVVEWNGKLLGLSEGSLPTIINPTNFDFEGYENFQRAIPDDMTFTAHPRFDPKTGDMFAYGIERRPPGILHAWHVERKTNKVTTLAKISLNGFFMVHDAMLTENYFLIMVPPMQYDIQAVMTGQKTLGDALDFNEKMVTRMIAVPRNNKNGTATPIEITLPPEIAFHFGNAYEFDKDKISFEMISGTNRKIFDWLKNWKRNEFAEPDVSYLTQNLKQITVDLGKMTLVGRVVLAESVEFPRYDTRLTGQKSRVLYSTERTNAENAAIIRVDLQSKKVIKAAAGKKRTFGEPVFVSKPGKIDEERGYILAQGYDADKNETFLEIRDAQTLEFASRIWANGQHFPIGFHGNFYSSP